MNATISKSKDSKATKGSNERMLYGSVLASVLKIRKELAKERIAQQKGLCDKS